ncbi:MAG: hypothetical protein IKR06_03040 [Erysipelotrichaceae bacterium]|nr:hypothetical protein [Erysipelotrichaceae bacterium]MBR2749564.1 hypothetical protein [Clostridiales bacterium]MBR4122245.1 hypothetical protein [Erysipelotrichaceae bacterium]
MRIIKKILNWLGLLCLIGGLGLMTFAYFSNRSFLNYISNLLADAKFGVTVRQMLFGLLLVIVSLILFGFALKAGGVAKRHEKEKAEADRLQREENEARTRKMQQEAEQAKAEAERMKAEAQQILDNRDNVVAETKETTTPPEA